MILNADTLQKRLEKKLNIICFETLPSTNGYCMDLGKSGKTDTLVIANSQTNGKGRLGRTFYSENNCGLYMSLLFSPKISAENIKFVTVAAAVAAAKAIEKQIPDEAKIKWVNDIYVNGKKVCGILCESSFKNSKPEYIVLGIGINLIPPANGFNETIKDTAAALFNTLPENTAEEIASDFLNLFLEYCENIEKKEFLTEYKKRSYLDGCTVNYEKDGKENTALVLGIGDEAEIILKQTDGEIIKISAGDVSLKKQ